MKTQKINTSEKENKISDHVVGSQRTQTTMALALKTYGYYVLAFIIPLIAAPLIFFAGIASDDMNSELSLYVDTYSYSSESSYFWRVNHEGGKAFLPGFTSEKVKKLTPSEARSELMLGSWSPAMLLLLCIAGGFVGIKFASRLKTIFAGAGESDDDFVRGGKLISPRSIWQIYTQNPALRISNSVSSHFQSLLNISGF